MAGSISNGWALVKQSWNVLRLDKELLLFPILSTFSCLLVLASFAVPLIVGGAWHNWYQSSGSGAGSHNVSVRFDALFYVIVFALYFVNYFVVTFFNAALVSCAIERFGGGNPTVSSGLSAAMARLPQIAGWALVGATVGMILQMIEERAKIVGKIVVNLIGVAWSIATYFAVPVLVVERVGPIEAVKRSAALMSKTWGTALVGNVSIAGVVFLLMLAAMVPAGVGIALTAGANLGPAPVLVGIGLSLVLAILLSLVTTTLKTILVAALYEFAATGKVPQQFDEGLLKQAFRAKITG